MTLPSSIRDNNELAFLLEKMGAFVASRQYYCLPHHKYHAKDYPAITEDQMPAKGVSGSIYTYIHQDSYRVEIYQLQLPKDWRQWIGVRVPYTHQNHSWGGGERILTERHRAVMYLADEAFNIESEIQPEPYTSQLHGQKSMMGGWVS